MGFAHLINDAVCVVLDRAGSFDLTLVDVLVHGQIQLGHDGVGAADAAVGTDHTAGNELLIGAVEHHEVALAAGGDVAGAVEQTWTEAAKQIKAVVEKVVFPALDMILAIAFFVKLGGAYFDFRQRGQFEWTGPAILFACLIFTLTAPKYIWSIIGI